MWHKVGLCMHMVTYTYFMVHKYKASSVHSSIQILANDVESWQYVYTTVTSKQTPANELQLQWCRQELEEGGATC